MAPASRKVVIPPERSSARLRKKAVSQVQENLDEARKQQQTQRSENLGVTEDFDDDQSDDGDDGNSSNLAQGACNGSFQTKTPLPNSAVIYLSIAQLDDLFSTPFIDLNPEYQRDVVWNVSRMSGLIDSLMENYYIPPVIFNKRRVILEDGAGRFHRTCVDGKQRLSSVSAFLHGDIPCHDKDGKSWYYSHRVETDAEGKNVVVQRRKNILPDDIKAKFREKQFVCYDFDDLSQDQEEDLFARVQMGVQLSPAEKMRATNGPWQDFVRLFERDFQCVVSLSGTDRSAAFRNLLMCFTTIYEIKFPSNPNGKPALRACSKLLETFMKNGKTLTAETRSHLFRVFTRFKELVETDRKVFENNGYRTAKKFAPVEMVAVACLISMYSHNRNNELLLGDIREMRLTLRQHMPDLRTHRPTWDVIWQFLEELEDFRGTVAKPATTKRRFQAAAGVHPQMKQEFDIDVEPRVEPSTRNPPAKTSGSSRAPQEKRKGKVPKGKPAQTAAKENPTEEQAQYPTPCGSATPAPSLRARRSQSPDSVLGHSDNEEARPVELATSNTNTTTLPTPVVPVAHMSPAVASGNQSLPIVPAQVQPQPDAKPPQLGPLVTQETPMAGSSPMRKRTADAAFGSSKLASQARALAARKRA